MAQKISEDTNVTLDLKTIGMIVGFTISLVTMYFTLKADIANAAELPKPEVTQVEFSYKDQLTRTVVEGVQSDMATIKEDVKDIKLQLDKMDERLYEISKK
jgi:hypothetical protein|tara:strand:+ start:5756 stop:6058 length:303 start_codon:yes stop_codon:yes gene_type:complete